MTLERSTYEHLAGGLFGLRHLRPSGGGSTLLCFPHAGGQSLAFRHLAKQLDGTYGIAALDPPGHGWSPSPPLDDIAAIAEAYDRHLPPSLLAGAVFLGHSMGGYVAYALAERLATRGRAPAALIVSATRPPHRRAEFRPIADLPDDVLVGALRGIAGAPPTLLAQFLPAIRADFRAFERWEPPARASSVPALVIGGTRDRFCSPHHILEWDRYFPRCDFGWVDGPHLFHETNAVETAAKMSPFVRRIVLSERGVLAPNRSGTPELGDELK